jgi:DNA-binding NarL/FixJ family response regulator
MKQTYSILIVDDHALIVDGYKNALEFGFPSDTNIELNVDFATSFEVAVEKIESNSSYDLIILDLSLPKCSITNMNTGEDFGARVRLTCPKTRLLIITSYEDSLRISIAIKLLDPEGFLTKGEISSTHLIMAVDEILKGNLYYSDKVIKVLKNRSNENFKVDTIDIQILSEMTNGTKNIDLSKHIPMSKSGIEKRKRLLKKHFKIDNGTNRELIMVAKEKGYI